MLSRRTQSAGVVCANCWAPAQAGGVATAWHELLLHVVGERGQGHTTLRAELTEPCVDLDERGGDGGIARP
ncbi:hypothetical protein ACFXPY_16760 [Streptomyces sp. NPDC059153]|uniref:hypothetical protein n=1 Tax=Streptomyces sp. NPDC059153 TaxID=3346743 RepID=UPI0036A08520